MVFPERFGIHLRFISGIVANFVREYSARAQGISFEKVVEFCQIVISLVSQVRCTACAFRLKSLLGQPSALFHKDVLPVCVKFFGKFPLRKLKYQRINFYAFARRDIICDAHVLFNRIYPGTHR